MDVGLFLHLYRSRGRWVVADLLATLLWSALAVAFAIKYYDDHLSARAEIRRELGEAPESSATFLVWLTAACGILALWHLCRVLLSMHRRNAE